MDQILEGCKETIEISNDICVCIAEQLRNITGIWGQWIQLEGLVFNKSKCKIKQKQIKFYGLIWDENGFHPDPEKCDRIRLKPIPANQEELQQFLGMIQYLSLFIPKLSSKIAPLMSPLKKRCWVSVEWNTWNGISKIERSEIQNWKIKNWKLKDQKLKIYV